MYDWACLNRCACFSVCSELEQSLAIPLPLLDTHPINQGSEHSVSHDNVTYEFSQSQGNVSNSTSGTKRKARKQLSAPRRCRRSEAIIQINRLRNQQPVSINDICSPTRDLAASSSNIGAGVTFYSPMALPTTANHLPFSDENGSADSTMSNALDIRQSLSPEQHLISRDKGPPDKPSDTSL